MIEIKITADTALEALRDLTELTAKMTATMPQQGATPATTAKKGKAITPPPAPTSAPGPAPADQQDAKDTPPWEGKPEGEDAPTTDPEPPAPTYTIETIRAAGVKAAEVHGKDKVKAVLTSLGVTGMTQLTKAQYPEFMGKLGELDA